jgi:hypothetical protein
MKYTLQHEAFLALLEFLYTNEVAGLLNPTIQHSFLMSLRKLADQYLVEPLTRCVCLCDT